MVDIFLSILMNLKNHGEITTASIFDSDLAKVTVKSNGKTYDVCITERKNLGVNKDA